MSFEGVRSGLSGSSAQLIFILGRPGAHREPLFRSMRAPEASI